MMRVRRGNIDAVLGENRRVLLLIFIFLFFVLSYMLSFQAYIDG